MPPLNSRPLRRITQTTGNRVVIYDSNGRLMESNLSLSDLQGAVVAFQDPSSLQLTESQITNLAADLAAKAPNRPAPVTKTSSFTVSAADNERLFLLNTTSGAITVTLPAAATAGTERFIFAKIAGVNGVAFTAQSGDGFSSSLVNTLLGTVGNSIVLDSDGVSKWVVE